jgi:hypothetical protein
MARWLVPITIVEYGRVVEVEATDGREARRKARGQHGWISCGDPDRSEVRVSGISHRKPDGGSDGNGHDDGKG